ncbi:MAG: hypothetical protein J6J38_00315 [Lachnospiraceae bacterium]|nr:hypothetical protein [Lachnospiraceae bacterium]
MTDGMEQAFEHIVGGILFGTALLLLLWFHRAADGQLQVFGKEPERLILLEQDRV